ncbi:MAG: hypothetical protein SGPRY_005844 [Prymnesium sp.]
MIPKTGTTSLLRYLNSCRHGTISPSQRTNADGSISHVHLLPSCTYSPHQAIYTTLRHPIDRFVSFLNFRQSLPSRYSLPGWADAWPFGTNNSRVVDAMRDDEMRSIRPFSTITDYLTRNKNSNHSSSWKLANMAKPIIFCSVMEIEKYASSRFGFSDCNNTRDTPENVSPKAWGEIREDQRQRIGRVFAADIAIWERYCGSQRRIPGNSTMQLK